LRLSERPPAAPASCSSASVLPDSRPLNIVLVLLTVSLCCYRWVGAAGCAQHRHQERLAARSHRQRRSEAGCAGERAHGLFTSQQVQV
jgi:hypothetical protein